MNKKLPLIFIIASNLFVYGMPSKNITIENKCDYTVWPGISNSRSRLSNTTGFALEKGESRVIIVESYWLGAIWGRTLCSRNSRGKFSCATGDCDSGEIECSDRFPTPMNTTLAEFQMDVDEAVVLYRVNVVDGYNLPLQVVPQRIPSGLEKICSGVVGCDVVNLNQACPYELMVVDAEERPIACTNPCRTSYCMPSSYSESFKVPCPEATLDFSDDNYGACTGSTDYVITFCPSFTPVPTRRVKSETKIETFGFTNETTPGAKHDKSPSKLKVIIGIATAALLVMIIIGAASIIVLRAKNARRKNDWSEYQMHIHI